MHPRLVRLLADVRRTDVTQVGGKAAILGELCHAGFPIPDGLCVTTAAFDLALGDRRPWIQRLLRQADPSDPAAVQTLAGSIADILTDLTLPIALDEALATALPQLTAATTPLAVRSSATSEDGVVASYAGQYATTLGVCGMNALRQAILTGWRSFFSANALVARAVHHALATTESMALLIQPLLIADCAGVAFSVDPVHQRRDLLVINATWGLGVGVVDGTVANDTVWIRRADLTVDHQQIVEKREQIAHDEYGKLIQVSVPTERQRAACLPSAWLKRIAQFTVAAETHLGAPQDVEWAVAKGKLWLLQARPITALPAALAEVKPFPVAWHSDEERRALWQRERKEGEPDVLLPLNLDNERQIASTREEGCRLLGVERNQVIKLCNGRIYVRSIPMPWTEADCRIRRAAMRDLRTRLQEQGLTAWDHWGPEIVKATERLSAFERESADGPALAEHLEEVLAVGHRHRPLHPAMTFKPPDHYYAAFSALSGLSGEEAENAANRLLDSEETPLTQLIDELYALACLARQEPAVAALVANAPADGLTPLRKLPQAAPFLTKFEALLDRYGERTGDGWGSEVTLSTPTWREDPTTVLALIAPYLAPTIQAPATSRQRARRMREVEISTLYQACADPEIPAKFRRQLTYARKVSAVVEVHNHYLDQMYTGQLRQAVIASARWLVAEGLLPTVEAIFWLYFAEITDALRTLDLLGMRQALSATIAARQVEHRRWQAMDAPPLLGIPACDLPERPGFMDEVTTLAAADEMGGASAGPYTLTGLGASQGRYTGRARVATDSFVMPELRPGDILVAENIGPMWTPLFPLLGGLVLERGSVGQHAAATAREYGVPAAICVKDACRYITDGTRITVDGKTGAVEW